jgi:hypothetical protein
MKLINVEKFILDLLNNIYKFILDCLKYLKIKCVIFLMNQNNLDISSNNFVQENIYNTPEIIDSIAIARETYFFTYYDDNYYYNSNINEKNVLRFIYEQIANIYSDNSLISLLYHMKYFYDLNFPEYENIFNLFYISVYPQAIRTDRITSGIIQINSNGNEVYDSFISTSNNFSDIINNLINPNINNISRNENLLNRDISTNRYYNNSLMSEIAFLSTIFNMQNNESILHVLNLMNTIIEQQEDQCTVNTEDINILETCNFSDVKKNFLEKNSDYCTICQENYDKTSQIKILPCEHFFHCSCIEPWLLNCSNLCPICRKNVNNDK